MPWAIVGLVCMFAHSLVKLGQTLETTVTFHRQQLPKAAKILSSGVFHSGQELQQMAAPPVVTLEKRSR